MGAVRPERPLRRAPARAGVAVDLEVVPGADHFFEGAPDVEAIFERAVGFLLRLDAAARRGASRGLRGRETQ